MSTIRTAGACSTWCRNSKRNGHSLQHFSRELARYFRNLLVAKIAGKPTRLIAASDQEQQECLPRSCATFSEEDLTRYLQLSLDLFQDLQASLQPRLHLEIGLVKLVHAGKVQSIEEALAGLGRTARPSSQVSRTEAAAQPRAEPIRAESPESGAAISSRICTPRSSKPD